MKKLTLSVAALTIAMMSYGQTQCKSLTTDSVQCKNTTKTEVKLCYLHNPNYVKVATKSATVCSELLKKVEIVKTKQKIQVDYATITEMIKL